MLTRPSKRNVWSYKCPLLMISAISVVFYDCCRAQQAPFGTKKFDYNASYRHNLCDRQEQLFNDTLSIKDALRGLNLTVYITNYANTSEDTLFALTDEGVIPEDDPGLFAVMLDELANRSGFNWRNSFTAGAPINEAEDGNKTWTDLLQWSVDAYDISAEKWARGIERMAMGISFPEGWYDFSLIMITVRNTEATSSLWGFLRPFDFIVWAVITGVIFASGILYYVLERLNKDADERNLRNKPAASVFLAAITFTGHFEFEPNTHAARIWSFSWTFFGLVLASAYTANLASFLVLKNVPLPEFNSIEEAIEKQARICVQGKTFHDEYMTAKYPQGRYVRKSRGKEVIMGTQTGECDVAVTGRRTFDIFDRDEEDNADCGFEWVGRTIHNIPAGFATAVDTGTYCTSLISYVFDLYMLEMQADGFFDEAWDNYLAKQGRSESCDDILAKAAAPAMHPIPTSLSMADMGGVFLLHAIFSSISLILGLGQYYRTRGTDKDATDAPDTDGKIAVPFPDDPDAFAFNPEPPEGTKRRGSTVWHRRRRSDVQGIERRPSTIWTSN